MHTQAEIKQAYESLTYSKSVKLLDWMWYEWKMETNPIWTSIFKKWEKIDWWTFFIVKIKDKKWYQAWFSHDPYKALNKAVWTLINGWYIDAECLFL